ncbi:DNA polymerase [Streptomyces lycii]|uniref:DNA-directed DNA polymerase n=1 Tax=Streptomyces lycii TaxID=2654337 RepID=A0ABQ7FI06_9ACTN|nr:DNA polymerase [Streptomyces lycii]KAF4408626.1 DNA polymerase [Streptomyces lycii]
MREYRGSLGGVPWAGWLCERPEDLRPFMEWVRRQRGRVAFDTEGRGLKIFTRPDYLRLCQFGTETEAWVVPVELGPAFRQAAADALRILPSLVGHNVLMHDGLAVDRHLSIPLEEFCPKTEDTMITAKQIDPREAHAGGIGSGLKAQSAKFIDPAAPDTQEGLTAVFKGLKVGHTKKNPVGWDLIPWDHPIYVVYSMLDVILGSRLITAHEREMRRLGVRQALIPYEHNKSRQCAIMARAGMIVDPDWTAELGGQLEEEQAKYGEIAARYGVENVNSNNQIIEALRGMGEVWSEKTDTGKPSVAKDVLLPMADLDRDWEPIGARKSNPLANAILRAQRAGKWNTGYVDQFLGDVDADGRIHPNINTLEARTGRMSVTGPALQTLPSGDWTIRRCLLAEPGHVMVSIDFSAIELRVLAGMADVSRMKTAIAAGEDLHDFTARLVFGPGFTKAQRKIAKVVGLGKVYGSGAETASKQTGAPIAQIRETMAAYDRAYPEIRQASNRWQREARWDGYVTRSATGRRLPLDRSRAYAVVNYKVQSTARDVLGQAMDNCEAAGLLPYMRLPVHDEILASVPRGDAREIAAEFKRCMTMNLFGVPIDAEPEIGGRSWGSLYMKTKKGKPDRGLLAQSDPLFRERPELIAELMGAS